MFKNTILLYGSSFCETAATQNIGHPQGISLTSLVMSALSALANFVLIIVLQISFNNLLRTEISMLLCPDGEVIFGIFLMMLVLQPCLRLRTLPNYISLHCRRIVSNMSRGFFNSSRCRTLVLFALKMLRANQK